MTYLVVSSQGSQGPAGPSVWGGITGTLSTQTDLNNALAGKVDAVNSKSLTFDTAHVEASAVGRLKWNDTDGTLDLGLKGGNVILQIGQEQVLRVVNKTGVGLLDSQAVYVSGAQGQRLTASLAQANSEVSSSKTIGILTEDIADNAEGYITTHGLVRNINTNALTEGAAVWLSPSVAGGLTTTRPAAPNHAVFIGWCTHQHLTQGSIFVHVQNGYELDELHDVLITTASTGDILSWDGTKWVNSQPGVYAASYTPGGTTSIAYQQDAIYYCTAATSGTSWSITGLPAAGKIARWTVELTNGGLFAQSWFSGTKWDGGVIPTLTSNGLDIITFYTRDGGVTKRAKVHSLDSK